MDLKCGKTRKKGKSSLQIDIYIFYISKMSHKISEESIKNTLNILSSYFIFNISFQ